MTTAMMRKQLIAYLSDAEDKKIKSLYTLLENNININDSIALTPEELRIVDTERILHLNGQSRSYTWEEAKEMIRKRKAS